MEPRLKLPKRIVLSNEAALFCVQSFRDELFEADALDRFCGGDADRMWAYWQEYNANRYRYFLGKLRSQPWWARREYIAKRTPKSLRAGLYWQVRIAQLQLEHGPGHTRVYTDWLSTIVQEGPEPEARPDGAHTALARGLVYSKNYFEWCRQGGDPDLGRYLATYFDLKMPAL